MRRRKWSFITSMTCRLNVHIWISTNLFPVQANRFVYLWMLINHVMIEFRPVVSNILDDTEGKKREKKSIDILVYWSSTHVDSVRFVLKAPNFLFDFNWISWTTIRNFISEKIKFPFDSRRRGKKICSFNRVEQRAQSRTTSPIVDSKTNKNNSHWTFSMANHSTIASEVNRTTTFGEEENLFDRNSVSSLFLSKRN